MSRASVRRVASLLIATALLFAFTFARPHISRVGSRVAGSSSALVGNWVGESVCTDALPSCHDEKVIYRIDAPPNASGEVEIEMDKIVDGRQVNMGVIRCKYDSEKGTLVGDLETPRYKGIWEFTVKSNTMEGTLSLLPAKTIARRVKVIRDHAQSRPRASKN